MTAAGEIVKGVARPARREDYEPLVRAMRPLIKGEELTIRASLLLMRDKAMATKNRACAPAWALLDVIERTASENALNGRVPLDTLRELRRLCLSCVMAASGFDALFRSSGEGEADAGGE